MRHRLIDFNYGIGNPDPVLLSNNGSLTENPFWDNFLEDACKKFNIIKDNYGFDFQINRKGFSFGLEPAYEGEDLFIIHFNFKNKDLSFYCNGRSFGPYGSNIVKRTKFYKDYQRRSKIIKFIDQWYDQLKQVLKQKKYNRKENRYE